MERTVNRIDVLLQASCDLRRASRRECLAPLPWAAGFAQANHGVPDISRPAFRASQTEQGELHKVKITPFSDQGLDR